MLVLMINIHGRVWQWVRKMLCKWFILQVFNSGHHEKSLWKVKPTDLRLILSERERYVARIMVKSVNIKAVFELLVTYRHSKGQPS